MTDYEQKMEHADERERNDDSIKTAVDNYIESLRGVKEGEDYYERKQKREDDLREECMQILNKHEDLREYVVHFLTEDDYFRYMSHRDIHAKKNQAEKDAYLIGLVHALEAELEVRGAYEHAQNVSNIINLPIPIDEDCTDKDCDWGIDIPLDETALKPLDINNLPKDRESVATYYRQTYQQQLEAMLKRFPSIPNKDITLIAKMLKAFYS